MSDGPSSVPGLVPAGTGKGAEVGCGVSASVLVKAGILELLGNGTPLEDSGVCVGLDSSSDNTVVCRNGDVVSAAKLAVLRTTFAPHQFYRRSEAVADASMVLKFGLIRPQTALASDANLDSVWTSKTHQAVLLWKSGVSETISRWACHCDAASSLKKMARTLPPFRYITVGGSPAVVAPSDPEKRDIIGPLTEAQARYGQPASVEVVRDGLNITLYRYGPHALPGLIAAAQRLAGSAACDGCQR